LNLAIDAINSLIEKAVGASAALGPAGFVVGKVVGGKAKIPHIPALAQGGIVSSPTLALIGEAGPEAVVPLDRMNSMGGAVNITIQTGVGDPVAIGREVKRVMDAYNRRAA
jgi:phage-related minor tail protein